MARKIESSETRKSGVVVCMAKVGISGLNFILVWIVTCSYDRWNGVSRCTWLIFLCVLCLLRQLNRHG